MERKNIPSITLHFGATEGADRELALVPYDSVLWDTQSGAYGNVVHDVKLLMGDATELSDWDNALLDRRACRTGQQEDPDDTMEVALENLVECVAHQMSFYPATLLVVPYLVKLLEEKCRQGDFDGQLLLITNIGMIRATEAESDGILDTNSEVVDDYKLSILKLQELTKRFLEQNIDKIRHIGEQYYKEQLLVSVLAILGQDTKLSFVLSMSYGQSFYMVCPVCEDCNEDIEFSDEDELEEVCADIVPAEPVIGKWDGASLEDTYVWYSNLLVLAGADRYAELLSYYYGTYRCPECGKEGKVIDFVKNYYFDT